MCVVQSEKLCEGWRGLGGPWEGGIKDGEGEEG